MHVAREIHRRMDATYGDRRRAGARDRHLLLFDHVLVVQLVVVVVVVVVVGIVVVLVSFSCFGSRRGGRLTFGFGGGRSGGCCTRLLAVRLVHGPVRELVRPRAVAVVGG